MLSTVTGRAPRKTADMYIIIDVRDLVMEQVDPYWLPGGKQIYIKTKFNLHSKQKYSSSFKISPHFSRGAIAPIAPPLYKSATVSVFVSLRWIDRQCPGLPDVVDERSP